jgi:hypothetical protein
MCTLKIGFLYAKIRKIAFITEVASIRQHFILNPVVLSRHRYATAAFPQQ